MADLRTTLTELATALGCVGAPSLAWAVLQRPATVAVDDETWCRLDQALHQPELDGIGEVAYANGEAFAAHPEGLAGRPPRLIEWTGGRGTPGDQKIPADLRIDHVYLVSCKYLSKILINTSPARLVDHLLDPTAPRDGADWFARAAPDEYGRLLRATTEHLGLPPCDDPAQLSTSRRRAVRDALRALGRAWPEPLAPHYRDLCTAVSGATADALAPRLRSSAAAEKLLWRMLRLAGAPYFVLGVSADRRPLRLRVMTPWDWRQAYTLEHMVIRPDDAGQPQLRWTAEVVDRAGVRRSVDGRIELRWSHGRFGSPPEAKIHLDTPHEDVPGYVPLA